MSTKPWRKLPPNEIRRRLKIISKEELLDLINPMCPKCFAPHGELGRKHRSFMKEVEKPHAKIVEIWIKCHSCGYEGPIYKWIRLYK